jgi:subtilisin family serine protease
VADITGAWIGSTTAKRTISGTSMASPHVAGVMAQILSQKQVSPAELFKLLQDTATKNVLTSLPRQTVNYLLFNGGNSV